MRKRYLALGLSVATAVTLFTTGVAIATTASASGGRPASVNVVHTPLSAPAVNAWVNGSKLIGGDRFTWGHRKTFVVAEGRYTAVVTLPGSKAPVIGPATRKLKEGYAYQVCAYGSAKAGYGLAVVAIKVGRRSDEIARTIRNGRKTT